MGAEPMQSLPARDFSPGGTPRGNPSLPVEATTTLTQRAFFSRLLGATQQQRVDYSISGGGTGLHWESLDEDISVEGLLLGVGDRTRPRDFA